MLTAKQRAKISAPNLTQPKSVPAPIKGWNTRDALDAMDPLDAIQLDNWYPDAAGVLVRNGYEGYATTEGGAFSSGFSSGFDIYTIFTSPVQTLAQYSAGSIQKFLAAAGSRIFDISSSGISGPAIGSGYTNAEWQTVLFLGRLFFANGADTMQVFDGATLAASTFTGVTLSTLIGGCLYQNRLFFWATNSTGFYYAALNSISGALTFYDLAGFTPNGGNLVAAVTFSHDGGAGVTDNIAFIMSSGDCLVFLGNDPSNANAWALVARYRLSPPVNPRAVCGYGGEAFVTTFDDHVPLQAQLIALRLGQLAPRSKVSGAVQAAVAANIAGFGWQALFYPKGRRLIFNIPNTDGTFDQHVQNTGTSELPWCRFVGMPSQCWGLFGDSLYFGADGGVIYKADTGNLDNLGVINAVGQQAWNQFGSPLRKRVTAARPVVQSLGGPSFTFSIGFDYGNINNIQTQIVTTAVGSPWDTSPWDTSPWSSDVSTSLLWHGVGGTGQAAGWALSVPSDRATAWLRTDFRGESGSGL